MSINLSINVTEWFNLHYLSDGKIRGHKRELVEQSKGMSYS